MVDYDWLWLLIGGFSWVELDWLAASTARVQESDYSHLSYYTVRLQLYRMNIEK